MSDTTLAGAIEEPDTSSGVGALVDATPDDDSGVSRLGGEPATAVEPVAEAKPVEPKAARKKPARKGDKQSTAETIEALVTTLTTMADSVSTLTGTIESLSEKVSTPPAPEPAPIAEVVEEPEPVAEEAIETQKRIRSVAVHSVGTLAQFVGVGLVAAAVMRKGLDLTTLVMAAVGLVLYFLHGLLVEPDRTIESKRTFAINIAMIAVAVCGLGLLVGGIQRFGDAPHRAAVLIPAGAACFLVATAWKARHRLAVVHLVWMAGVGVWVCLFLAIGLGQVASHIDPKPKAKTPAAATTESGAADAHTSAETTGSEAAAHETAAHETAAPAATTGHESAATESGHESTTSTSVKVDPATQSALQQAVTAADHAAESAGH